MTEPFLVNIAIVIDKISAYRTVHAELSSTPGLVITPAYVADNETRETAKRRRHADRRLFNPKWAQIIHQPSGALVATFYQKVQALNCAQELGLLAIDWTQSQSVLKLKVNGTPLRDKISQIIADRYGREPKPSDQGVEGQVDLPVQRRQLLRV